MDYARHVLKSVISRLESHAPLEALVDDRVYSDVPQGTAFPYVVVSITSEPFATCDMAGQQHTLRIQVFGRQDSMEEVLKIRAIAHDALDRQEASLPALDAGTLVKCEATGVADAFNEDDGKTWQALCEFDVITV